MAHEKQYWKDALQAAKPEGSRPNDTTYKEQQKKQARIMYNRRVLQKDIKKILDNKIIKYTDIVRIHRKHGVYTT